MARFLNKNIKRLREALNLSQLALEKKTGIDRSTISRIENNEIETTIENAIKLSEAFEIPLNILVNKDLSKLDINNIYSIMSGTSYTDALKQQQIVDEMDKANIEEEIKAGTYLSPENFDEILEALNDLYNEDNDGFQQSENDDDLKIIKNIIQHSNKFTEDGKKSLIDMIDYFHNLAEKDK